MTLQESLEELHVLLVKDTDYPASGEEDYDVRKALLQSAVRVWGSEEGVLWNELYTTVPAAATGDKTTVNGTASYTLPTDFRFPIGRLRLAFGGTSTYYEMISGGDVQHFDNEGGTNFWYITGNAKAGRTLTIKPTPTTASTIYLEYYKDPTVPTGASSVFEMSDPQFAIYWALAELVSEEDPGLSGEYRQIALNKLSAMKIANDSMTWGQGKVADGSWGFGV